SQPAGCGPVRSADAPDHGLWVPKRVIGCWPAGSPAVRVACLAGSRTRDDTDALPDVRPPGRVDGAAGTFFGVERRRAAGAAPRGGVLRRQNPRPRLDRADDLTLGYSVALVVGRRRGDPAGLGTGHRVSLLGVSRRRRRPGRR